MPVEAHPRQALDRLILLLRHLDVLRAAFAAFLVVAKLVQERVQTLTFRRAFLQELDKLGLVALDELSKMNGPVSRQISELAESLANSPKAVRDCWRRAAARTAAGVPGFAGQACGAGRKSEYSAKRRVRPSHRSLQPLRRRHQHPGAGKRRRQRPQRGCAGRSWCWRRGQRLR